jgi:NADH:ubiquinone oxidoreductase subunit 3 (subunit A)
MLQFVVLVSSSLVLVLLLKLASSIAGEQALLSREELSPYECGFEHHNVSRIPLSLRYFLLTLVFLLFDLEVVFILFCPFHLISRGQTLVLLVTFFFVLFLVGTLLYE